MFAAVPLYIVYAVVQGCVCDGGYRQLTGPLFWEYRVVDPYSNGDQCRLRTRFDQLCVSDHRLWCWDVFLGQLLDQKFNFATPGRNGNYETEGASDAPATASADGNLNPDSQVVKIIHLLGGRENIADVDACMTRLRVSVKIEKRSAMMESRRGFRLDRKDNGVQAVYGLKADVLKSDIQDILDSGVTIPEPTASQAPVETTTTKAKA